MISADQFRIAVCLLVVSKLIGWSCGFLCVPTPCLCGHSMQLGKEHYDGHWHEFRYHGGALRYVLGGWELGRGKGWTASCINYTGKKPAGAHKNDHL